MNDNETIETIEQCGQHLEFLGYEIVERAERGAILIRHPGQPDTMLQWFSGAVLHLVEAVTEDYAKQHIQEFLGFLNVLNDDACLARFYADDDMELRMEALYVGEYDRARYGQFLSLWERDFRAVVNLNGSSQFLS